jgi:hypothetical protein
MKVIFLTKGKISLIDDIDYLLVTTRKWSFTEQGYAVSGIGKNRHYLHRFLLNAPKGVYVDHINGNKLDNRRSNLRIVNPTQSRHNERGRKNKSGLTGIWKHRNCWVAEAKAYGEKLRKYCHTKKEAIVCRKKFLKELNIWK